MAKQRKTLQMRRYSAFEADAFDQLLQEELADGWRLTAIHRHELRLVRTPDPEGTYVTVPDLGAVRSAVRREAPGLFGQQPVLSKFVLEKWLMKSGADFVRFSGLYKSLNGIVDFCSSVGGSA